MNSVTQEIAALHARISADVAILGHHYQSDAVIQHTDFRGDSLELARRVPDIKAKHIVFCGVYFMAESAALLASPGQRTYLPAPDADCVMSRMAPSDLVETVLVRLNSGKQRVLPLAYVNTSLAVKAVVGRFGGAVCTSANAGKMLAWAMNEADVVLFLPDKNLGLNTARQIGLDAAAIRTLNIRGKAKESTAQSIEGARLLLWPGCCAIHARFTVRQIEAMRTKHLGCIVAVHPECPPGVAAAADTAGSTSTLIRLVERAPDGSTIVIGTETNLVNRLMREHDQRLTILPLEISLCSNMAKTTETHLLHCLRKILDGTAPPLDTKKALREPAQQSLTRMLSVCS